MNNKKGFTLIELLAVIVILGIVVAIAIPGINSVIANSRKKALDSEAKIIHQSALRKMVGNPDYDFSHINKNNLKSELETNGTKFDFLGIENRDGYLTVTVTKDGYTATSTNDPDILNPKIYGLKIDFSNPSNPYTRLEDSIKLCENTDPCAGVGTDTEIPINKFDAADIYKYIQDVVEDGNHFVSIPKFYIKKTVNGDIEEIRISRKKHDNDYYLPNVFKNHDTGRELNYVLIGKYSATLLDGKLGSALDQMPRIDVPISTLRNEVRANGSDYQLIDIHAVDLIQTLFYIEFATLNSTSIMKGNANPRFSIAPSGQTNTVKSTSGSIISNTSGDYAMMYRGIENIYGNVVQAIDGINIKNKMAYISKNPDTYESNKFNGDYIKLGYELQGSNGNIERLGFDANHPYVSLPISQTGAGGGLYKAPYMLGEGEDTIVFLGGNRYYPSTSSLTGWFMRESSTFTHGRFGSRVIKRGS